MLHKSLISWTSCPTLRYNRVVRWESGAVLCPLILFPFTLSLILTLPARWDSVCTCVLCPLIMWWYIVCPSITGLDRNTDDLWFVKYVMLQLNLAFWDFLSVRVYSSGRLFILLNFSRHGVKYYPQRNSCNVCHIDMQVVKFHMRRWDQNNIFSHNETFSLNNEELAFLILSWQNEIEILVTWSVHQVSFCLL